MKLDNFFVGTFVGITMLGFYDRAYNTAQWPGTFCSLVLSRSVFFVYSRLQDDVDRLKKTASMVTWLVTTFSFPLGLVIFIVAPDLIVLLYGEAWLPSVTVPSNSHHLHDPKTPFRKCQHLADGPRKTSVDNQVQCDTARYFNDSRVSIYTHLGRHRDQLSCGTCIHTRPDHGILRCRKGNSF